MTTHSPRILDLTDDAVIYATRLLADLGADVIRIEPPGGREGHAFGEHFAEYFNAGKRSVALDLRHPRARVAFARLCRDVDVVVEGIAPAFDRVEIVYAQLRESNPRLTWVAIREFAPGAAAGVRSNEIVRCALSGLMSITGDANGPPMIVGGGLSNAVVATYGALAACLGVMSAGKSGRGNLIWVSAYEALLSVMQQGLYEATLTGKILKRAGGRHAHVAMAGALPCRDGHVVISANEQRMWRALVELIGDERLADNAFNDEQERMRRQAEIFEIVTHWAAGFAKADLSRMAQDRHIPIAPVHSAIDVARDPHLRERDFFRHRLDDGETASFATPWARQGRRAPRLGEHTDVILREAGLTPEQIKELEADGLAVSLAGAADGRSWTA